MMLIGVVLIGVVVVVEVVVEVEDVAFSGSSCTS